MRRILQPALVLTVEGVDEQFGKLDIGGYKKMLDEVVREFPNMRVIATTLRTVKSATVNDWSAICGMDGEFHQSSEI